MKHNVRVEVSIQSLLHTKSEYESEFEIPISDSEVRNVYEYLSNTKESDGIASFMYNMGVVTDCYLTYHVTYDEVNNVYALEVLFDGAYFGLDLLLDGASIVVLNGLSYDGLLL